jgi:hypothetical protein
MATIPRETITAALPQTGRGDLIFGVLAVVVGLLAILAKLTGLFA